MSLEKCGIFSAPARRGYCSEETAKGERKVIKHKAPAQGVEVFLEVSVVLLLVDVTVTLPLLAFLESAGDGKDHDGVNACPNGLVTLFQIASWTKVLHTDNGKDSCEDVVNECVDVAVDGRRASTRKGSGSGAHADFVGGESRRGAVEVATAFKLQIGKPPNLFILGTIFLLHTEVCMRLWTDCSCSFQISKNSSFVRNVRTQRNTPMHSVKTEQMTTANDPNLSTWRVGMIMPGSKSPKARKTMTALAMPASRGNCW